jgi:WD40 repeat protein
VGRWGVFGDKDGVRVYTLRVGAGMQSLIGLQARIERVEFSHDGRLVAALSDDWRVGIWNRATGELRRVIAMPPGFFSDNASFSLDSAGRRLAFSGGEHATLWDLETGSLLRTWKLPPGLDGKLAFHGPEQLSLFRTETRDGVPPLSAHHPKDHPRVYRLYNLLGPSPLRPLKEIGDHDWYCFAIKAPADGRFLIADGTRAQDGHRVRSFIAYDGRTGETLWSMPSHHPSSDRSDLFDIDPTGDLLLLYYPLQRRSTWLKLPGREWMADRDVPASVLGPGAARWFSLVEDRATQKGEWHYFPYGQEGPDISMVEQDEVGSRLTFGPDGRQVAWGSPDHSVVVCDLGQLQRAMAEFGLGW